jgi:hypothetical protein
MFATKSIPFIVGLLLASLLFAPPRARTQKPGDGGTAILQLQHGREKLGRVDRRSVFRLREGAQGEQEDPALAHEISVREAGYKHFTRTIATGGIRAASV